MSKDFKEREKQTNVGRHEGTNRHIDNRNKIRKGHETKKAENIMWGRRGGGEAS